MPEERVTRVSSPESNARDTIVVTDGGGRSSGGGGWAIALVLLVVLGLALYYFADMNSSRSAKDRAIAGAAEDVGAAAQDVGKAAKDAADSVKK